MQTRDELKESVKLDISGEEDLLGLYYQVSQQIEDICNNYFDASLIVHSLSYFKDHKYDLNSRDWSIDNLDDICHELEYYELCKEAIEDIISPNGYVLKLMSF